MRLVCTSKELHASRHTHTSGTGEPFTVIHRLVGNWTGLVSLGEGANDLRIPSASWIPVWFYFLSIWWVFLYPCLKCFSFPTTSQSYLIILYYVTRCLGVSFALCNLLTFTALPTSFPHSPPFMQFCSVLLYLTSHLSYSPLPVQSFPTMWVLVLAGLQMCVMYFRCFSRGACLFSFVSGLTAQIQSLELFRGC